MNVTLKNIKYAAFASHETDCFEATVYIDGKRLCAVSNDGHGGCDDFHDIEGGLHGAELYKRIEAINAELGKKTIQCETLTIANNLEIEIGERLNDWLRLKQVKKSLKKICYAHGGKVFTVSGAKPTAEGIAQVKKCSWWKPEFVCLNLLPVEQASAYFL